ncbi:MAG: hypothetical protein LBO00_07900 [Zoogloeaceae bacterium]|nr:hypothetical protein [Zoogloeaceae bacterium]
MNTGLSPAAAADEAWRFILNAETRKRLCLNDDTLGVCQGVSSPELAFTLRLPAKARTYRIPERKTFTLYRGPFGLAAMEQAEYRALSRAEAQ